MKKQDLLFSESEMRFRKSANEAQMEESLKETAIYIVNASEDAINDLEDWRRKHPIASRQRNFMATNLNSLFVENMIKSDRFRAINRTHPFNNTLFEIGGSLISIKKLDERFRPQYNHSKSSKNNLYQMATEDDDLPFIFLGYQTNEQGNKITSIYVIYLCGNKLLWKIDVLNLAASQRALEDSYIKKEVALLQETTVDKEADISIKKDKKKIVNSI